MLRELKDELWYFFEYKNKVKLLDVFIVFLLFGILICSLTIVNDGGNFSQNFYGDYYVITTTTTSIKKGGVMIEIPDIYTKKTPEELLVIEKKRIEKLSNTSLPNVILSSYVKENDSCSAYYSPDKIKINLIYNNDSLNFIITLRHELFHHYSQYKCRIEDNSLEESIAEIYSGYLFHKEKFCEKEEERRYCFLDGLVEDRENFMQCIFEECREDKFLTFEEVKKCYT